MILVFFNTYIIPLSNHTKIEDTCFDQELYATNQYCWVNNLSPPFCAKFSCTQSSIYFALNIGHRWVLK